MDYNRKAIEIAEELGDKGKVGKTCQNMENVVSLTWNFALFLVMVFSTYILLFFYN